MKIVDFGNSVAVNNSIYELIYLIYCEFYHESAFENKPNIISILC